MKEKRKSGRPKKQRKDRREIHTVVHITKAEQLKLWQVMNLLSAGSASNAFRMLLNNYEL